MPLPLLPENSISNIFNSMALGECEISVEIAKKWVLENVSNESPLLCSLKYSNVCGEWISLDEKQRETLLQKFLTSLQKHNGVLVQILVLQKYTYLTAKSIVDQMINNFQHYIISVMFSQNRKFYQAQVELDLELLGIWMIFNPMACILTSGGCPVVNIDTSNPLLPFFLYLGSIFNETKFPKSTYSIQLVNKSLPSFGELQSYIFPNERSYCPWLILEDADLESSAKTLMRALCGYKERNPWTPSHIYIQESVFQNFVEDLKTCFGQIKCGSRFNISTEIEEEPSIESKFQPPKNLPTLKPFEGCNLILGVGWSLEEVDEVTLDSSNFVSLLPFRSMSELVSLVKKNPSLDVVCLWSERLSSVNHLVSQLSFSTLWVNCFLEIDPKIPFDSAFSFFGESIHFVIGNKLALLGVSSQQLLMEESTLNVKLTKPLESFKSFMADNLLNAIDKSKEGYLGWQKVDSKNKIFTFMKFIGENYNKLDLELSVPLEEILNDSLIEPEKRSCDTYVRDLNVHYQRIPLGVVVVHLDHFYSGIRAHLNTLLVSLIAYGNSVVVAASNDATFNLALICASELTNKYFTKTIVVVKMYETSGVGCLKAIRDANLHPLVGGVISLGLVVKSEDCRAITCDSSIVYIPPTPSFVITSDFLRFVSTRHKCVWMPAK